MDIKQFTREIVKWDWKRYRNSYPDLKLMNPESLFKHVFIHGLKERRKLLLLENNKNIIHIDIIKRNFHLLLPNDFNCEDYISLNSDLKHMDKDMAKTHYIYHGNREARKYKDNHMKMITIVIAILSTFIIILMIFMIWQLIRVKEIQNPEINICIIYPYYERKNSYKNQTNLSFFIKHGLNTKKWRGLNITTLFIINNKQSEILIPDRDDIIIWKREYNNEYDVGSYRLGIEFLEKRYRKKFYNIFSHLFIINAGVFGPIYKENTKKHWIEPFLEKMKKEKSVICSPVINFIKWYDAGHGPKCQTYCSMIKIDKDIYNLLLHTKVCNKNVNSGIKYVYPLNYDYVFTTHKEHYNTILIGEYGLTRVLMERNYNISCLLYDDIDYHNENEWENYSGRIDRHEDYKDEYFEKCIFIKNNWIININSRDSLPVLYDKTRLYYYKMLNLQNIEPDNILYDYDFSKIAGNIFMKNREPLTTKTVNGILDVQFEFETVCDNKKEAYEKFGHAEEYILWPRMKYNNKSLLIYSHYDKDNIIKNYVVESLRTYIILGYDIIFCTTSEKIVNLDLPFEINYFKNRNDINQGNDLNMVASILNTRKLDNYDWITVLNDSILLPIHGIENFRNTIDTYRLNNDIWGLFLNNDCQVHICTCHFEFKKRCLPKLREFFHNKMKMTFIDSWDLIQKVEIKMIEYMGIHLSGFKYDGVVSYDNVKYEDGISHLLHYKNVEKYINRKEVFGFKWKYFANYLDYEKTNNKTLNYLMRFLNVGDKIPGITGS